jgi:hypothetical protein
MASLTPAAPIRLWACIAHHTAFRCGGWASVRDVGGVVTGFAGGQRNTTPRRMALAGLAAALRELPPGAPVRVETSSPELAALTGELAAARAAGDPDLDLWTQIHAAAKGRHLDLVQVPSPPETAAAFVAAWADAAMNKGKSGGLFSTAIPKSNLAKMPRA